MKQYHPIALQQADRTALTNRHIRHTVKRSQIWAVVDEPYEPRQDNEGEVEIVFELPKDFLPAFLEYKQGARAKVQFAEKADDTDDTASASDTGATKLATDTAPSDQTAASEDSSGGRQRRPRRGGRARGVTALQDKSFFGDALPLKLKDYRDLNNLSVKRRKMQNGHLVAELASQEAGTGRTIRAFQVDQDKRLLHLNMKRLHARSGIGRALDFAAKTVQNYFIEDSNGNQIPLIGKYAIATVNGERTIEIQYFPEQAGTIGGLGAFKKIKDKHLKDDYELVLLFLVDPGSTVTSFSAGGSAQRRDDLTGDNLVAPD